MAIQTSPVNVEERQSFDIQPGDTVRVYQKVVEKGKTRMQPFEGMVIARKHGTEPGATFTVRRTSSGVGVERIFPLYSPNIDKIEVLRRARVRRAKLYYIREKVAREIRRQMRRMKFVDEATESETERAQRREEEAQAAEQAQEEQQAETKEANEEEENAGDDTPSSEEQTQNSEEDNSQEETADEGSETADEEKEK